MITDGSELEGSGCVSQDGESRNGSGACMEHTVDCVENVQDCRLRDVGSDSQEE